MTFTVAVQGPFAPNRVSGDAVPSQSLKSPTIETLFAPAASKVIGTGTARTSFGAFAAVIAGTLADADAAVGMTRSCAVESAPRVTNPIASAAAASSAADATETVGWRIHSSTSVRRLGAFARRARTAAKICAIARAVCRGIGLSAPATRSISSSRSSIMLLHPGQSRAQRVARPLDPHAQRGKANTRQRCNVFVRKILDVTQQERFPLRRGRNRNLSVLDQRSVPPVPGQQRAAPVHQNPEQPRIEPRLFTKPVEAVVHSHESVLHCFFGVLVVRQHVPRETQAPWIIELHDLDEGLFFTAFRPEGHRSIDFVHGLSVGLRCLPQIIPLRSRTPPPTCPQPVNRASFTSTRERVCHVTKWAYFCAPRPSPTTVVQPPRQEHP